MIHVFLTFLLLLLAAPSWAAITFGDTDSGVDDAANNSVTTAALTVNAGDAVVCGVKWETAGTLSSISDGTNSLTLTTNQAYASGAAFIRGGYLSNASGGGSGAFTATFSSSSADYKRIACVTYAGVATSGAFDVQNTAADTLETNAQTGAVTTTNNDNVCTAWGGSFTTGIWSGHVINSVSATSRFSGSDFTLYDRIVSATFTGEGVASHSLGSDTAGAIVCLKADAGGGPAINFFRRRLQ